MGCNSSKEPEIPEEKLVEIRAAALKQASAAFNAEREKLKSEVANIKADLAVAQGELSKVSYRCYWWYGWRWRWMRGAGPRGMSSTPDDAPMLLHPSHRMPPHATQSPSRPPCLSHARRARRSSRSRALRTSRSLRRSRPRSLREMETRVPPMPGPPRSTLDWTSRGATTRCRS